MNRMTKVEFDCVNCREELEIERHKTASPVTCPACSAVMTVQPDDRPQDRPPAPAHHDDDAVPVRMGFRRLGTFETKVSRNDAGRMGHTMLGGLLALLGVIVAALFGINMSNKS